MATQPTTSTPDHAFVYGQGATLQSLNILAAEIAGTDMPVLLVGESGSGKNVYARVIHRLSGTDESSFLRINCGALDAGQRLSDARGAFQPDGDSLEKRPKTVFLDSVHELDAACQRVLLSFLPDGSEPKGVDRNLPRIISSTSCNFEKELEAGRFRLELYFRINGVILRLPALRERKEDIPDLLECFVLKHSRELKKSLPEISREARKLLFSYDWPGNIRELENVARRIVATGNAEFVVADLQVSKIAQPTQIEGSVVTSLKMAARAASRRTERELILKALEETHWNRKRAARDLQISYKSLLLKMKQVGAVLPLPNKGEEKSR